MKNNFNKYFTLTVFESWPHTHILTHMYIDRSKYNTDTHSSILAWRIPWTGEPGRLQSIGSQSQTRLSNYTHIREYFVSWASLVSQRVKNLPEMQETWVSSLDWEDPLEKATATHSSILAWRIPWTEEPGRLQPMGVTKSWTKLSDFHFQNV